jgi:hypothetical protein
MNIIIYILLNSGYILHRRRIFWLSVFKFLHLPQVVENLRDWLFALCLYFPYLMKSLIASSRFFSLLIASIVFIGYFFRYFRIVYRHLKIILWIDSRISIFLLMNIIRLESSSIWSVKSFSIMIEFIQARMTRGFRNLWLLTRLHILFL